MTDYISREAAMAVIEEKQKELCPLGMYSRHAVYGSDREKFDAWQEIIDALERIPAADVRPVVRGQWESRGEGFKWVYICSACGFVDGYPMNDRMNFCPNCGAMMEES